MKMNFREKSENVMFLHSLRLSYMQKIRKFYRAVFRENIVRQKERQRERDGPEFKGPPDAIAKPSDQKNPGGLKGVKMNFRGKSKNVMFLHSLRLSYMQKIRKFYRAVFRENRVRQTERDRERRTRIQGSSGRYR